jgi:NitT/TauT family transport system substrate-binding protein
MAADGKEVKAFVTLTRYSGAVLLTSPEGAKRIRRIEDLKGANVGVTAPASSSHFFLNYLLVTHGLSPDDVHASFVLRRAPAVRVLADTRTAQGIRSVFGVEQYPSAVLYATASWLHDNADKARRLSRSIQRTLRWIKEHSASEIAAAMPAEFTSEDPAAYVEAIERSKQLYSLDGIMHGDAAAAVHKVLSVSIPKVRNAKIDLSRTYTNEFAAQ